MSSNNLAQFTQRANANNNTVSDMLQHLQRMNLTANPALVGRPSTGYTSNNSVLGSLAGNYPGSSAPFPSSPFPGGNNTTAAGESVPSPLDLNEFPTLRGSGGVVGDGLGAARHGTYSSLGGHTWGGMTSKPPVVPESSVFTMSKEDFPALPPKNKHLGEAFSSGKQQQDEKKTGPHHEKQVEVKNTAKKGIQISHDGKVTNIPPGMVKDQFGMIGLLTFLRTADGSSADMCGLGLGIDLTTLGLSLNNPEHLYPNFGGPWADSMCRPQDIDYHVPQEYLVHQNIKTGKLSGMHLERYGEDLLFYMFYTNVRDVWQLMAANELYNRDWRYHKQDKVWITRAPGMTPLEKTISYERGTYFYFDVSNWRKAPKEFYLEYEKLDNQPPALPYPQKPVATVI